MAYCERHPRTETELSCGRCETPICPQCMVHAPGG
ncbi:MAG: rhomboid family intramembrane serine protease, partial [Chloroflexi bacterium]|nr:rhomboid family intramembrane serine protease [Chloroflexota bacterium]